MSTEFGAVVIAILALLFSVAQWFGTRRSERLRLLLGEMETVGFEASGSPAAKPRFSEVMQSTR
jgi:hypothetical protein